MTLYASDLDKNKQTDAFMGEGFEEKLKEAEEADTNLVIGKIYDKKKWYLEGEE